MSPLLLAESSAAKCKQPGTTGGGTVSNEVLATEAVGLNAQFEFLDPMFTIGSPLDIKVVIHCLCPQLQISQHKARVCPFG